MAVDFTKSTISFSEIEIPEQKLLNFNSTQIRFPTVLSPIETETETEKVLDFHSFIGFVKSNRSRIEELLQSTGAVLLRGFPITTASEFNDVVEAFGYEDFPYVGGAASRSTVVGRVITANEAPPDCNIPFHHELSHTPQSPSKLFFFCETEPKSGGETPIFPSNLLYQMMLEKYPDFVKKLEEQGLCYSHFMGSDDNNSSSIGRSWKSTFSTDDKIIAEQRARDLGMKLEWTERGVKNTMGPRPAFRVDKTGGNKIWFNNMVAAHAWRNTEFGPLDSTTFGDRTPLPFDAVDDCTRMLEEGCVAIPWKRGDVLLLDNFSVLHSRRSFEPPRRILASFTQ